MRLTGGLHPKLINIIKDILSNQDGDCVTYEEREGLVQVCVLWQGLCSILCEYVDVSRYKVSKGFGVRGRQLGSFILGKTCFR